MEVAAMCAQSPKRVPGVRSQGLLKVLVTLPVRPRMRPVWS